MAKIITIRNTLQGKMTEKNIQNFIEKFKTEEKYQKEYTASDIDKVVSDILELFGYKGKERYIPIIKIVNQLGFKTCQKILPLDISGEIYVNGDTEKLYGENQVIIVNKIDDVNHKRFVIAHELAHYLFDFLPNPKYKDVMLKYNDTYKRNEHDRKEERVANKFAAELLMPKDIFRLQYYKARDYDNNPLFITLYLSKFFRTTEESISKRIMEII